MNKQDLCIAIIASTGVGKFETEAVVSAVFKEIEAALWRRQDVKIAGFGTFRHMTTKARTARNPRTGETVAVPARNKAKFKASSKLKV